MVISPIYILLSESVLSIHKEKLLAQLMLSKEPNVDVYTWSLMIF